MGIYWTTHTKGCENSLTTEDAEDTEGIEELGSSVFISVSSLVKTATLTLDEENQNDADSRIRQSKTQILRAPTASGRINAARGDRHKRREHFLAWSMDRPPSSAWL